MDVAFCGTYYKLRNYEEQPEEALDWLLAYHGEAPGHQVMITLLDWANEDQGNFIDALSHLNDEDADHFIERLTFAITDTVQSEHFEQLFIPHKDESERLNEILERLKERESGQRR